MQIVFRILDRDHQRAEAAERGLREAMKAHRIAGDAYQVAELLEFSRIGLKSTPALELNGLVISQGEPLTIVLLDDVCRRLAKALKRMDHDRRTKD